MYKLEQKIGHGMVFFISAHLIIMEKSTTTCSFMALLIFGDALKKSQRDLRG